MKILSFILLMSLFACKQEDPTAQKTTSTEAAKEDCDDKAKKIEIKNDEVNLLGNNTGCTLDEAGKPEVPPVN